MLPVGVATQAKPPQTVKKQYGRGGFGDQSATGPLFPIGLRGPVASSTALRRRTAKNSIESVDASELYAASRQLYR
jgi:hypothetical protein